MNAKLPMFGLLAAISLSACSFHARGPEDYRKDVRKLLEQKDDEIQSCYQKLVKENKKTKGTVVLKFVVKSETGEISDVKVKTKNGASEELSQCVTEAVKGLKLDPPDQRDGKAEFTYEFKQK